MNPADLEPRSIMTITPNFHYDSRDSFIRPHSGGLAIVSVDISKGLENSLDDFLRYTLDLRAYHSPVERLTLAGRAWAGYVGPYGNGIPPQDQLFFLGGTGTVRGFGENQLRTTAGDQPEGGRLAFLASLRKRISSWATISELIPFVDTGSVQQADNVWAAAMPSVGQRVWACNTSRPSARLAYFMALSLIGDLMRASASFIFQLDIPSEAFTRRSMHKIGQCTINVRWAWYACVPGNDNYASYETWH